MPTRAGCAAAPAGGPWRTGPWRLWLDVGHNHNQGRFDAHSAGIHDYLKGTGTTYWLGSYVAHLPTGAEAL